MNFFKLFTILLCVGIGQQSYSATNADVNTGKSKKLAHVQVKNLQNGALLVRLHTKNSSIAALRSHGFEGRADQMEQSQRKLYLEIVKAFRRHFTFCPVFFFFSDYSDQVRSKDWVATQFLNDSLVADFQIKPSASNYFTAEFSTIDQDTSKFFDYHNNQAGSSSDPSKNYYSGSSMGFGALLIKSDQFIQLKKPFPFYVRTFDTLPIKRKTSKVVIRMNKQLHEFQKSIKSN